MKEGRNERTNERMYFTVQYSNKRKVAVLSHNVIKTKQTVISLTPYCEHLVPIISTFLFVKKSFLRK